MAKKNIQELTITGKEPIVPSMDISTIDKDEAARIIAAQEGLLDKEANDKALKIALGMLGTGAAGALLKGLDSLGSAGAFKGAQPITQVVPALGYMGGVGYDIYKKTQDPELKERISKSTTSPATLPEQTGDWTEEIVKSALGQSVGREALGEAGTPNENKYNPLAYVGEAVGGALKGASKTAKTAEDLIASAVNPIKEGAEDLLGYNKEGKADDTGLAKILGGILGGTGTIVKGLAANMPVGMYLDPVLKGVSQVPGIDIVSKALGLDKGIYADEPKPIELFEKSLKSLDGAEQKFVIDNFDKYLLAKASSDNEWKDIPNNIVDTTGKIARGIKGLESVEKDIDIAVKNKDLGAFSTAINNALAMNSVMNEQGVITDPEAARLLSTVQETVRGLSLPGVDQSAVARFFGPETWSSVKNAIAVMNNAAKARLGANIALAPKLAIPVGRLGINLENLDPERGMDKDLAISKEERDALAVIEAKIAGAQVADVTLNKALGMLEIIIKRSKQDNKKTDKDKKETDKDKKETDKDKKEEAKDDKGNKGGSTNNWSGEDQIKLDRYKKISNPSPVVLDKIRDLEKKKGGK